MSGKIKWFARPLQENYRLMAAARITCHRLDIPPMKLLYCLVFTPDKKGRDASERFPISGGAREKTVWYVRHYFMKVYNNEKACVDYLNKDISARYFPKGYLDQIRDIDSTHRDRANEQTKVLMDSIFERLKDE